MDDVIDVDGVKFRRDDNCYIEVENTNKNKIRRWFEWITHLW